MHQCICIQQMSGGLSHGWYNILSEVATSKFYFSNLQILVSHCVILGNW